MQQGELAECMYLIVAGVVCVQRTHPDLIEPVVFAELGPGEVVGEMERDHKTRSATVIALAPTEALEITPRALEDTLLHDPQGASTLLRVLSSRFRRTEELRTDLPA